MIVVISTRLLLLLLMILEFRPICARAESRLQLIYITVVRRYGVFSKMQRKGASLEQVYDVRALRIIVKRKEDCYAALREVERLWTPVDGRFKVRGTELLVCTRHAPFVRLSSYQSKWTLSDFCSFQ